MNHYNYCLNFVWFNFCMVVNLCITRFWLPIGSPGHWFLWQFNSIYWLLALRPRLQIGSQSHVTCTSTIFLYHAEKVSQLLKLCSLHISGKQSYLYFCHCAFWNTYMYRITRFNRVIFLKIFTSNSWNPQYEEFIVRCTKIRHWVYFKQY